MSDNPFADFLAHPIGHGAPSSLGAPPMLVTTVPVPLTTGMRYLATLGLVTLGAAAGAGVGVGLSSIELQTKRGPVKRNQLIVGGAAAGAFLSFLASYNLPSPTPEPGTLL